MPIQFAVYSRALRPVRMSAGGALCLAVCMHGAWGLFNGYRFKFYRLLINIARSKTEEGGARVERARGGGMGGGFLFFCWEFIPALFGFLPPGFLAFS